MNAEEQIRRLLDLEAIRDLPRRYAHCVWAKDVAGAARLFTEDGIMDTGSGEPLRGRAAILATYTASFAQNDFQPFVHNHVIELDADRASGVCYLDLRASMDGASMIGAGRYDDVYVRAGEAWLFQSRKLSMDYLVPLVPGWTRAK